MYIGIAWAVLTSTPFGPQDNIGSIHVKLTSHNPPTLWCQVYTHMYISIALAVLTPAPMALTITASSRHIRTFDIPVLPSPPYEHKFY